MQKLMLRSKSTYVPFPPERLPDLFPAEELAGSFGKQSKQLQGLVLNLDCYSGFPEFVIISRQLEGAKPQNAGIRVRAHHVASQPIEPLKVSA
jgi:hypothetical protein